MEGQRRHPAGEEFSETPNREEVHELNNEWGALPPPKEIREDELTLSAARTTPESRLPHILAAVERKDPLEGLLERRAEKGGGKTGYTQTASDDNDDSDDDSKDAEQTTAGQQHETVPSGLEVSEAAPSIPPQPVIPVVPDPPTVSLYKQAIIGGFVAALCILLGMTLLLIID